jgi:hypothetical protein
VVALDGDVDIISANAEGKIALSPPFALPYIFADLATLESSKLFQNPIDVLSRRATIDL